MNAIETLGFLDEMVKIAEEKKLTGDMLKQLAKNVALVGAGTGAGALGSYLISKGIKKYPTITNYNHVLLPLLGASSYALTSKLWNELAKSYDQE